MQKSTMESASWQRPLYGFEISQNQAKMPLKSGFSDGLGGVHGLVQVIEKILGLNKTDRMKWLRIPLTFLIVNFAWILFYNTSLSQAFDFMGKMFTTPGGFDLGTVGFTSLLLITVSTIILLIRDLRAEWWHFRINKYMYYVVYVLLFCMILSVGVLDSSTFIYQNF